MISRLNESIVRTPKGGSMELELQWSSFHTPYTEAEVRKFVPIFSGVYLLWVKYKSGKWECFYVGRAQNLEQRLLDHLGDDEPDKCIKNNVQYRCGFYWAEVSTEPNRIGVEKALFDYYRTECNDVDPGGTPIHVNVPAKRE